MARTRTEGGAPAAAPPAPLRILAAAGDARTRDFYREALPRLGHHVCVAASGRDLVDLGHALAADLIITDAALPDGDGLAAVQEIFRKRPAPAIVVSAGGDEGAAAR